jgi:probable rRNA maturation factor
MIAVTVRKRTGAPLPLDRREMARVVQGVLAMAGMPDADLEVAVVGDEEMEQLNRDHAGCPGPTNVLSFPLGLEAGGGDPGGAPEGGEGDPTGAPFLPSTGGGASGLGLVALSRDTLEREALLYGQDPAEHCARLLAHGTLHLCGLDHGEAMEAMTEQAMTELGRDGR